MCQASSTINTLPVQHSLGSHLQVDLLTGHSHHKCGASRLSWTGTIRVNGQDMSAAARCRLIARVPQDQPLLGTDTVRECLSFSLQLSRPFLGHAEHVSYLDQLIEKLVCFASRMCTLLVDASR